MTSGQTAECFYLKCGECQIPGSCSCFCHKRRSDFYETLTKTRMLDNIKSRHDEIIHNRQRGRPPRLAKQILEQENKSN